MPVPNSMADLATLAGSNYPTGTEAIGNNLDNYVRSHAAIIRSTNALASASIAAASTTDVALADGESVQITGSATITSLGTGFNGCRRELRFSGACTLTNSANLVLPNAANFVTVAGDNLVFRCIGSGQWAYIGSSRALSYVPVNKAGDTMSGSLSVTGVVTTTGPTASITMDDRGGSSQWQWYVQSNIARLYNNVLGGDSLQITTDGNVTATARIKSAAHFNATGAAAVLSAEGGPLLLRPNGADTTTNQATISTNGNLDITGTGYGVDWVATSDATLKDEITPIDADPWLVDTIQWAQWRWKSSGNQDAGVVAQDLVESGAGRFVHEGNHLAVNYSKLSLECVLGLAKRVRECESLLGLR